MPEIAALNNGYVVTWPEHNLAIRVSRLTVHKDGHVTAFIKISLKDKENSFTLLPFAQFNLSAPRTRSELANSMTEKKADIPWREAIDYLCREIQEKAWTGEPGETLEIMQTDTVEPPSYLLEPIIMRGVPSVVFGDKGVHKTTLSLAFGILISLPWPDNPLELTTNGRGAKVAMLDWESDSRLTRFTLQRLCQGMGLEYFNIYYKRCKVPLADDIDQISAFLDGKEVDTMIIDSLGAACGGDLFKPEQALRFFEAFRSLNRTGLIIAQNAKGEEGKKTIFGSTYFQYYSRNIFELKKSSDALDRDETKVALFHTEGNYSGKYDPIGFHLYFTPTSIKVEREAVDFGEFMEKVNRQQMLLAILKDGSLTTAEVADKFQISQATAKMTITRLANRKLVIKTASGAWGLPYQDGQK